MRFYIKLLFLFWWYRVQIYKYTYILGFISQFQFAIWMCVCVGMFADIGDENNDCFVIYILFLFFSSRSFMWLFDRNELTGADNGFPSMYSIHVCVCVEKKFLIPFRKRESIHRWKGHCGRKFFDKRKTASSI